MQVQELAAVQPVSGRYSGALEWLLEPQEPAVRALALRDLVGLAHDNPELVAARRLAHQVAPIATILAAMEPEGWWIKPGPGYGPKYKSGVWAVTLLAQLGAHVDADARVATACAYMVQNAMQPAGQFSANRTPAETLDCLQGNLCWALATLGCDDPRLEQAFNWLARSVTGEGVAPMQDRHAPLRYYAYHRGPGFLCAANGGLPCAWGATKVAMALGALAALEKQGRAPQLAPGVVERACAQTIDYLLVENLMEAPWPNSEGKPQNRDWWLPGFPLFYMADLLQTVDALCALGQGSDARLHAFMDWLEAQADAQGRWPLRYTYGPKTWGEYGRKGQPNKWVTHRALRVLKAAGRL